MGDGAFPESRLFMWNERRRGPQPSSWHHLVSRGFCSVPLLLVHHFFHLPGGGVFRKAVSGEAADGASDAHWCSSLLRNTPPCRVWAWHQKGKPPAPLRKSAERPSSPQRAVSPRAAGRCEGRAHLPQPQSFPSYEAMPLFPLNMLSVEKLTDFFV